MQQIGEFLTTVQDLLGTYIFALFAEPRVAIGLSLLILAIGVWFVLWLLLRKWIPFSRQIRSLEGTVRSAKGETEFAREFAGVDEAFNKVQLVRHGWSEFKETLVFPDADDEPIQNTARPLNYINLSEAETSGLHLKFFQAVPNYFVGVGLLFTFLGLVAAIFFASKGIAANASIAETQQSLRELLSAATFKFLTSIAGIFSSLLVAISYRLVAGNLQKRFDDLCEALEQRLLFATAESIAFGQYRELQKQTVQLERFNTDLAFSIAKELDSRLNTSLQTSMEKALAPLAATMNSMADRFGEMNQDAMSSMLNSFTEKLQQGAGSEMQALGASLAETKESLGGLVGALQSAGGQLNQTLTAAGHRLEAAASKMEQSFQEGISSSASRLQSSMQEISTGFHQQFTESAAKFSGAIRGVSRDAEAIMEPMREHLSELTDRLDGLSSGLTSQMDSIAQINTQLGSLVHNTAAAPDRLRDAGEPVHRASQAIGSAAQQIAESSRLTGETHQKLSDLAEEITAAVAKTTELWADYQKRFEQVDKDLATTFKLLSDGTAEQHSAIKQFVSGVDQELEKALRNLGAGVESLQDNLEEFTGVVDTLGKQLNGGQVRSPAS